MAQQPLAPEQPDLVNDGVGKNWAEWFLKYASAGVSSCFFFVFSRLLLNCLADEQLSEPRGPEFDALACLSRALDRGRSLAAHRHKTFSQNGK